MAGKVDWTIGSDGLVLGFSSHDATIQAISIHEKNDVFLIVTNSDGRRLSIEFREVYMYRILSLRCKNITDDISAFTEIDSRSSVRILRYLHTLFPELTDYSGRIIEKDKELVLENTLFLISCIHGDDIGILGKKMNVFWI